MGDKRDVSLKRKLIDLEDDSDEEPSKRGVVVNEEVIDPVSLLFLSDEILIEICQHLDNQTLMNMACTCSRLKNFVTDKSFWIHLDFSIRPVKDREIYDKIVRHLNPKVKSLKLRGLLGKYPLDQWKNLTVTTDLLKIINDSCPAIEQLTFYEATIDIQKLKIKDFPKSLKVLEFYETESISTRRRDESFFNKIEFYLEHLETLKLEKCCWFEIHDFIAFSKLKLLKHLSLRGCAKLKDCVPYCSISARFGFKNLEILDFRDTPVSDSDVQCFNFTETLRELYLECPLVYQNTNTTTRAEQTSRRRDEQALIAEVRAGNFNVNNPPVVVLIRNLNNGREVVPFVNNVQVRLVEGEMRNAENVVERPENEQDELAAAPQQVRNVLIDLQNERPNNNENHEIGNRNDNIPHVVIYQSVNRGILNLDLAPSFALISDRAILSYGYPKGTVPGTVFIRSINRPATTNLEIVYLKHYKLVTDVTLVHLVHSSPKIKFLDVTGTSVTATGVNNFKNIKPDCIIKSDFDMQPPYPPIAADADANATTNPGPRE